MSDSDVVSAFSSLDELIQVIYQGSSRFVVLSNTDETSWKLRLGLSESNGRWWQGWWSEKEIRKAADQASCTAEALGDTLASAFTQGEMYVGNWSSKKGAEINFVLGTNTNHPVQIPLAELAPEDAASFATQVFAEIAIQAQSRKSRLHPSPFESSTGKVAGAVSSSSMKSPPSKKFVVPAAPSASERKAKEEIKALKAELARERSRRFSPPNSPSSKHKRKAEDEAGWNSLKAEGSIQETSKLYSIAKGNRPIVPATAARGASLANPTKKARKLQTLEFGSDDD